MITLHYLQLNVQLKVKKKIAKMFTIPSNKEITTQSNS